MALTCFDITHSDHIAHVVMKRPEALNSMNAEFWAELPALIAEIDAGSKSRVIVISSTGKHFSAGMDLGVFASGGGGLLGDTGVSEEGRRRAAMWLAVQHLQDSFTALERCRIPVLAAIHGGCIGGAIDMVCAADVRYASADAFFCVQEINIGMTADVGTLQRLPKLIPDGVAREWAYTGDRVPAARAAEVGFVNQVFDTHEALVAGVLEIAGRIARHSPLATWGTKEMLNFSRDHTVADSLRYMAGWQSGMFQPRDMLEEFSAKGEGRDPEFERLPTLPEPW
ncbi:MAG: crotonase/enoyl-CoA hydratase family protein [Microthrixaceae bacterium]|nr:crotonase/enoyl-CoA hydratase family protein [Microthrixaceae bacterium]